MPRTLESWSRGVPERPDWTYLLVWADWCAEEGLEGQEAALRWLASEQRWPIRDISVYLSPEQFNSWDWRRSCSNPDSPPEYRRSHLPPDLFNRLPVVRGYSHDDYREFLTPREAILEFLKIWPAWWQESGELHRKEAER